MKKCLSLLISLSLMLSLVGCGSDKTESITEEQPAIPTYQVDFLLECEPNLLFNKYDMDVYVEEEWLGTLDHGAEENFSIVL